MEASLGLICSFSMWSEKIKKKRKGGTKEEDEEKKNF
jgi:hypothetical protein